MKKVNIRFEPDETLDGIEIIIRAVNYSLLVIEEQTPEEKRNHADIYYRENPDELAVRKTVFEREHKADYVGYKREYGAAETQTD